jgi:hypothetical protein
MPWEPERNIRSLSPHGLKAAEGHAAPGQQHDATNSVGCPEMGPGLLSMTPLGAGRSSPYAPTSSRRPRDEPREMKPPHDPAPHPYTPAAQKQAPTTYGKVRR